MIDKPHNLIRHPNMPRAVFKLLWDTLQAGEEIFAYVVNLAKNGDQYWVLAHATPSFNANGTIIGYHSTRRVANSNTVQDVIVPLYRELRQIESTSKSSRDGLEASFDRLIAILAEQQTEYNEFVSQLTKAA